MAVNLSRTENMMKDDYISEQRRQYTTKKIDTSTLRNPPIKCNDLKFIKPFEETHLRLAPKPLQELRSMYKKDFLGEQQAQDEVACLPPNRRSIENSEKLAIDLSKPGYAKYLDLSITSNRLDFYPYSSDQLRGIGAKDNITYWTWIKDGNNVKYNVGPTRQNLNDNCCIKNKYNPRNEFQILQNSVPNSGLTTETKSRFTKPDRSMDFDLKCIWEQSYDSSNLEDQSKGEQ